jgi:hypothetical protein
LPTSMFCPSMLTQAYSTSRATTSTPFISWIAGTFYDTFARAALSRDRDARFAAADWINSEPPFPRKARGADHGPAPQPQRGWGRTVRWIAMPH